MPTSSNVQVTHIEAGQTQKEVTANAAFDRLDDQVNAMLSVDFTSGDVTLTDAQYNDYGVYKCISASTSQILNLPARAHKIYVWNASGQNITVRVTGGGGANVVTANGDKKTLYCDATDVHDFS